MGKEKKKKNVSKYCFIANKVQGCFYLLQQHFNCYNQRQIYKVSSKYFLTINRLMTTTTWMLEIVNPTTTDCVRYLITPLLPSCTWTLMLNTQFYIHGTAASLWNFPQDIGCQDPPLWPSLHWKLFIAWLISSNTGYTCSIDERC